MQQQEICPAVPPHSKVKNHCLLFSPANIINNSNMIVMYHGLFTGRPHGFALAMIRQFIIWQIIINKSALEQQDGLTQRQEDCHVTYPAILESKSHHCIIHTILQ
jgi:hypothetical protein